MPFTQTVVGQEFTRMVVHAEYMRRALHTELRVDTVLARDMVILDMLITPVISLIQLMWALIQT